MIDPWIAMGSMHRAYPRLIFSEPTVPYPYPRLARSRIGLASPGGFRSWGDSGHGVPSLQLALLTQCGHQSALRNRISSQSQIGGIRSTETCCDESEDPGSADLAGFN